MANTVYEFGPFRLEPRERRLARHGRAIPLAGKALDTLCALLEHHGKLVPKRDLMNAVWPETTVEENNLDRNISAVRKALGKCAAGKSFIETVPRVGYRFAAPVTEIISTAISSTEAISTPTEFAAHPAASRAAMPEPESSSRQEIRFCVAPDKVRLAYATVGSGHPLVKVANCFNHLDFE